MKNKIKEHFFPADKSVSDCLWKECLFDGFTLDRKQEVVIIHILTQFNQVCVRCLQLAKDHDIRFFETSAKSSINVDEVSWTVTTDKLSLFNFTT